jgi:hypothetical protein
MNIDIYTSLALNSSPYAERLRKNLEQLKSGKHKIRYWAMTAQLVSEQRDAPRGWARIIIDTEKIEPTGVLKPSVNHAKLLNQIINHIPEDSNIVIIADCDMFVFPYGWGDFLARKLFDTILTPLDCIGTEKHDGSLRMFFTAFVTFKYRLLDPDFMPGIDEKYESVWTTNNRGNKVVADTGWRLEDQVRECGLKYDKFKLIGDQYLYKGHLFCAHLGGSHKKDFKSKEVKHWYRVNKTLIYR